MSGLLGDVCGQRVASLHVVCGIGVRSGHSTSTVWKKPQVWSEAEVPCDDLVIVAWYFSSLDLFMWSSPLVQII